MSFEVKSCFSWKKEKPQFHPKPSLAGIFFWREFLSEFLSCNFFLSPKPHSSLIKETSHRIYHWILLSCHGQSHHQRAINESESERRVTQTRELIDFNKFPFNFSPGTSKNVMYGLELLTTWINHSRLRSFPFSTSFFYFCIFPSDITLTPVDLSVSCCLAFISVFFSKVQGGVERRRSAKSVEDEVCFRRYSRCVNRFVLESHVFFDLSALRLKSTTKRQRISNLRSSKTTLWNYSTSKFHS